MIFSRKNGIIFDVDVNQFRTGLMEAINGTKTDFVVYGGERVATNNEEKIGRFIDRVRAGIRAGVRAGVGIGVG